MGILTYTHENGLADTDAMPWADNEDLNSWLARGGFERYPSSDGIDDSGGDGDGPDVAVYAAKDESNAWSAVACVTIDGNLLDWVLVASRADLLYLRMELLPIHRLALMRRMKSALNLLDRAFEAWHGHPADDICSECHAEEVRRNYEKTQELARAKAAAKAKAEEKPT